MWARKEVFTPPHCPNLAPLGTWEHCVKCWNKTRDAPAPNILAMNFFCFWWTWRMSNIDVTDETLTELMWPWSHISTHTCAFGRCEVASLESEWVSFVVGIRCIINYILLFFWESNNVSVCSMWMTPYSVSTVSGTIPLCITITVKQCAGVLNCAYKVSHQFT